MHEVSIELLCYRVVYHCILIVWCTCYGKKMEFVSKKIICCVKLYIISSVMYVFYHIILFIYSEYVAYVFNVYYHLFSIQILYADKLWYACIVICVSITNYVLWSRGDTVLLHDYSTGIVCIFKLWIVFWYTVICVLLNCVLNVDY